MIIIVIIIIIISSSNSSCIISIIMLSLEVGGMLLKHRPRGETDCHGDTRGLADALSKQRGVFAEGARVQCPCRVGRRDAGPLGQEGAHNISLSLYIYIYIYACMSPCTYISLSLCIYIYIHMYCYIIICYAMLYSSIVIQKAIFSEKARDAAPPVQGASGRSRPSVGVRRTEDG